MYYMQKLITLPVHKYNLKLTVNDGTSPIGNASVSIGSETKTTSDSGIVTFELDYGDYTATINATGYAEKSTSLSFRSNHKNFTVTLEEE